MIKEIMKIYSVFLMVLLSVASCTSQNHQEDKEGVVTITGTVGYPQQGDVILEKLEGNAVKPIDTIEIGEDYSFTTQVDVKTAGYYRLNFYNKQYVPLILYKDDIEVHVDGNSRTGFSNVTGSKDHDFIKAAQQLYRTFQSSQEVQNINQAFTQANARKDKSAMDSLRNEYLEREKEVKEKLIQMIDTTGASLGVVEILKNGRMLDKDKNYEVYKNYAAVLENELGDSPIAQEFITEVKQMGKLAIGQVAPELALPNPEGEIVKLSSLRGNYVLVDFWAKWCKPCRMENPNVVRMYDKYNDKGFEVYGVSLDRRREDWLQAIEEDNLHWTQVSDLKFWNSEAAKIYNVNSIPFALLLDPEGVIIGKNLRGRALEQKLEEIFSE